MRKHLALALAPAACVALGLACGSNEGSPPPPAADSGVDSGADDAASLPDTPSIPNPDAPTTHCHLGDNTDPFELCTLKALLQADLQYAYKPGTGAATQWDALSTMPTGHTFRDDLALASAISNYSCSAAIYGDTDLAGPLATTLTDLATVIEAEQPQAPSGYDGEVYFELRNVAAAYYTTNDTTNAAKIAQLADDYGRAIAAQAHVVPVLPASPGDAGAEGGDTDGAADGGATASDSGAPDASGSGPDGGDAGTGPGVVIGVPASGAAIAYAPDQVVTAAAALLDMAVLHARDPDAGAEPAQWKATAIAALDYVWRRARDPQTGLFYQSLVTSGDAVHDALGQALPTNDTLRTDVQAAIVLGLGRAQERFNALTPAADGGADADSLPPSNYLDQADNLIDALLAAKLWDGATVPGSDPGAFFEGLVPSGLSGQGGSPVILSNKTTFSNAYLMAGLVRILEGSTTQNGYLLGHLIAALAQIKPGNTSLLSAVTDTHGNPVQQGYLRAASRDYSVPVAFAADGGVVGPETPTPQYLTSALSAAVEAFAQRWRERPNPPACGL